MDSILIAVAWVTGVLLWTQVMHLQEWWGLRRERVKAQRQRKAQADVLWEGEVLTAGSEENLSGGDRKVLDLLVAGLESAMSGPLLQATTKRSFYVQVTYAAVPKGGATYRVQALPLSEQAHARSVIESWLARWPVLPVDAPLAVCMTAAIRGGTLEEPAFVPPFADLTARYGDRPLAELLEQSLADQVQPDAPTQLLPEHCERCLELLPDHPVLLRVRGHLWLEQGEFDNACDDFGAALFVQPTAADYLFRGMAHSNRQRYEEAIADATCAREMDPELWQADDLLGEIALRQEDPDRAFSELDAALTRHPEAAPLYHTRARAFGAKQEFERAEQDLSRAIELAPDWTDPLVSRAFVRHILGRTADAVADCDRWLELSGATLEARRMHCDLLFELEQWPLVVEAATRLLDEVPEEERAPLSILRGRSQANLGKPAMAIEDFTAALALDATNLWARAFRAMALSQMDEFQEAIPDADAALEGKILVCQMRWIRAMALWRDEDCAGAIHEMELATEFDPESDFARFWHARFLSEDGEFELARDVLQGLKPESENWETRWFRGNLAAQLGDHREALEHLSQAAAEEHVPPNLLLTKAEVALQNGDWRAAEADLNRLLEIDEDHTQALCFRGHILLQQGRREEGIRDLRRAYAQGDCPAPLVQLLVTALGWQKEFDSARELIAELRQREPESPGWVILAAELAVRESGPGAGDELLQEAIAACPEQADFFTVQVLLTEAQWEHAAEHYDAATEILAEALEYDTPLQNVLLQERAACLWYAGQLVEALDDLNAVLESEEDLPGALASRGHVLVELGEYEAALADLDRAVEKLQQQGCDRALAAALNGRSVALGGLERWDEAWQNWEQSLTLRPDNAWLHFNGGVLNLGQNESARAGWCFALALQCSDPQLPPRKRLQARGYLTLAATRLEREHGAKAAEKFRQLLPIDLLPQKHAPQNRPPPRDSAGEDAG